MTNIFTKGNIQTYYNLFQFISASEKEAIDQSISITAVVKAKNQQISCIAKFKQFYFKAGFLQRLVVRKDNQLALGIAI